VGVRLLRLGQDLPEERWLSADQFFGKYWYIDRSTEPLALALAKQRSQTAEVVTTEKLFDLLDRGYGVIAKDGPFETEEDGTYALDVAWESPE